ncbi:Importin beta-related nuclear transport receptor [Ceratocystis platani]|uniref:Importin beta-related nuclear transport receptor n=1 Tax=Ceratocystis fimbriata f. sp. platani TaxID=88771 RepID=A0A0F8CNH2_CERFI|nr:Importin beta-related nuclear transport receptor [Ceratocystis platani]
MDKQTDTSPSDASEISQLREELNRLKLKLEHTPATQADDQLTKEASRQRAKAVTIAKLGELHWSFAVPSHAVLSSATNWAAWFKNVQYALRELCLEIEDLKYLDSATHTRLLRQMHMTLSTKLQNKVLDCEDFEDSIDILRAATIGSRLHSEDDYAERLREFDFLPGESLSKMVDRYENLADEATSLGVKLDEKSKVTNLRVVISAKFPDLYLHLIVHKSWPIFIETVRMVTKLPKYKKAPIPRQNREQRTSATVGRRGGSCYNCDESGHHSNQCSKPRDAAKINAKINVKISSKRALGRQQNQGKNTNSSVHALDDENDEGIDSWRILMATAVMKGRVPRQFDIKAAYLHGIIQEDVYVSVPKELEDYFQRNPHISDHLGYKTGHDIEITGFADNKGSLTTANRTDATSRATRHIRADHFYIREKVADGSVALELVDTRHQIADALTKPLSAPLTKKYNKVLSDMECEGAPDGASMARTAEDQVDVTMMKIIDLAMTKETGQTEAEGEEESSTEARQPGNQAIEMAKGDSVVKMLASSVSAVFRTAVSNAQQGAPPTGNAGSKVTKERVRVFVRGPVTTKEETISTELAKIFGGTPKEFAVKKVNSGWAFYTEQGKATERNMERAKEAYGAKVCEIDNKWTHARITGLGDFYVLSDKGPMPTKNEEWFTGQIARQAGGQVKAIKWQIEAEKYKDATLRVAIDLPEGKTLPSAMKFEGSSAAAQVKRLRLQSINITIFLFQFIIIWLSSPA